MWLYAGIAVVLVMLVWYCRPKQICLRRIGGWLQLNGVQCQVCHIAAHVLCSRTRRPECKPVAVHAYKDSNPHHCQTLCGNAYVGAEAVLCSWCNRCAHIACSPRFDPECDFGKLKKAIIPPTCVKPATYEILELPPRVSPILVVVNSKSGGQIGLMALMALYGLLNPVQVIDLVGEGLKRLNSFRSAKRLRVLVAGGDGTVSSVVSAFYDSDPWEEPPPVGILPLGTGNDLSITLNWGKGLSATSGESPDKLTKVFREMLQEVSSARKSLLDRWTVTIGGKETYTLCNYMGIGLDAKVAWDFQKLRERKPYLFSSRVSLTQTANKLIYGHLGSFDLFSRTCKDLQTRLSVKLDGKQVQLPYLENLVVLNIPYFAGGAAIWGTDDCLDSQSSDDSSVQEARLEHFHLPSTVDRTFEVAGISSILHLGECQIGLKECVKIAQGHEVSISVSGRNDLPLQIDGEPQLVKCPTRIKMQFKDQVWMLSRNVEPQHDLVSKVYQVITNAEASGVINHEQSVALVKEIARKVKQ